MESFKSWYNEGWWDKAKQLGHAALNWSPVNQDTIGTYPGSYDQPQKAARALGNWNTAQQADPRRFQQQQQAPQQNKTVGFKISDMDNLKGAIAKYLGLIHNYLEVVHKQLKAYPRYTENIFNSFEKNIGPLYDDLYKKFKWIEDMNKLARSQYEWAVDEEVLLEAAIKVNYRKFEEMVLAFQKLAMNLKYWVSEMVKNLPQNSGQRLKAIYDQNILRQQAFVGRQVQWLQGKLQQLMQVNSIPYKQVEYNPRQQF